MSDRGMVIVGAGHAGCRAIQALRANGWQGRITLVNSDDRLPYERPPLSKAVLSGTKRVSDYTILSEDWLRENSVEYRDGLFATHVRKDVQEVELSDGSTLPYHRLLLATGSEPRSLDIAGTGLSGVSFLRTALEAEALSARMVSGARMVIIGGGLIGMEAAASAVARGCEVTVIEAGHRLMMRAVPAQIERMVRKRHQQAGVKIMLGRRITEISGQGSVTGVVVDDRRLSCDIVLICVGVVPRTALAAAAGLTVDNGIVVSEYLQTSDRHIFAAGDACCFDDEFYGPRLRLECWKNAEDQGNVAAGNMLGAATAYRAVPWMWSDQYEQTIQIAGLPERADVAVERSPEPGTLLVFHLAAKGQVLGVSGFGAVGHVGRGVRVGQAMIERRLCPDPALLANNSVDLRTMIQPQAA